LHSFYGVSKAMKSRYMFGGWLFPALRQKTCAITAAALICTPWRLARRHIRAKRI
jgi:hypothetical protein